MDHAALTNFIRVELSLGKGLEDVRHKLQSAGYPHEVIESASIEFLAQEHLGDILNLEKPTKTGQFTEGFIHWLNLDSLAIIGGIVAFLYVIVSSFITGEPDKGLVLVGLKSAQFLFEAALFYLILEFIRDNYTPEGSDELQHFTYGKALHFVILSGIAVSALRFILIPEGNFLLTLVLFFLIVFVRYVLLMIYFDVFSFLKFALIAVFFSFFSWGSTLLIRSLLSFVS